MACGSSRPALAWRSTAPMATTAGSHRRLSSAPAWRAARAARAPLRRGPHLLVSYFSLLAAAAVRRAGRAAIVVDWFDLWSAGYWRDPVGGRVGRAVQGPVCACA